MRDITHIIVHRTEAGFTGEDVNSAEHPNSYHEFIRQDGTLDRMIAHEDVAYHALRFNWHSIGIAVFGDFATEEHSKNNTPTPAQWATLVQRCRTLLTMYPGAFLIGHTECGSGATTHPEKLTLAHACPGDRLSMAQLRAEVAQGVNP